MPVLDIEKNAPKGDSGSGILYVSTDYDGTVYADGNGSNEGTSMADIETNFTFADVGYFENFAPYLKKGDERVILTDYCSVEEISRKVERIGGFTVDVQEILEMVNLAQILGTSLETVSAGASQKAEQNIGMKRTMKTNTYQLFKFVSCPDEDGLSNTFYFVKAVLNADVNMPYQNLAKDDFTGVTLDFEVAKAGNTFIMKETAVATA